jgi:DNA repair protein RecN (Recombination protein N)
LSAYNLADIEDRLYAIRSLARKHGCATSELEQFMSKSRENLLSLESKLKGGNDLNDKMIKVKAEYFDKAKILSQKRQIAGKELESKTMNELAMLDMKKATLFVEIKSLQEQQSSKGIDEIRFLASTNPGMPQAPIDKIASGGELSRFMLAFRAALFDKCLKPTVIFDEVDVGIGGSVADAIGNRLKLLSQIAQVIVITHQPQVAGKGGQHILVRKTQGHNTTSVDVISLDLEGRSGELARMISGKEITEKSLAQQRRS